MKLTCPGCGAIGSMELFTSDADARAVAALMGQIPHTMARSLTEYLSLFRPASRVIAWSRLRKLLEELLPLIQAGAVRRHGRDWSVPPAAWQSAMDQMVHGRDKLTLPLKSHGYLLEILTADANRAEAKVETASELQRRYRPDGPIALPPAPVAIPIETDAERYARIRREDEERQRRFQGAFPGSLIKRVDE